MKLSEKNYRMFLLRPIIMCEHVNNDDLQLEIFRLETFKNPHDSANWYKLGVLYFEKGETDLAIDAWHEAVKHQQKFADAYHELGVAYGSIGLFDEARDHFHKAIECDKNHIQAHYNLGVVLDVLGQKTQAWRQTKILRRFDPILSEMLARQLKRRYKQKTAA